ncbi:MAG: carbonic anhydrase family protein [Proteobacteria bacterium]|nr:carbonic anhydrase family protein [Pseudomonadota bacterium]
MKIVRIEFILLLMSLLFLPACSPQSSERPAATTASETPDSAAHSPATEHGGGPVHWGYGEDDGPASWAALSSDYVTCASGREQSPIDIAGATTGESMQMSKDYKAGSLKIIRQEHVVDVIDNGHTIQVNYDEGSNLRLGETVYELKQYHFHAPSEHTIERRHFPMEMHLVHQSAAGELAVLGVLIEQGNHNPAFEPVWANLPNEAGEEVHHQHLAVNVDDLLPVDHGTYRYRGSLTTPPCSEGVSWFVAVEPIKLSADQIATFASIFSGNNRPVQPLNNRTVVLDRVAERVAE